MAGRRGFLAAEARWGCDGCTGDARAFLQVYLNLLRKTLEDSVVVEVVWVQAVLVEKDVSHNYRVGCLNCELLFELQVSIACVRAED
jgi:hypothetical protein